jgi:aspartate/methionine/tyrosine aminotransferase
MLRFDLEDFFDDYEHRPNLLNLASSDALPWPSASALDPDVLADIKKGALGYPDPKSLLPSLKKALTPPPGIELMPTSGAAEAIAIALHESAAACTARGGVIGLPSPGYGAFEGLASLLGLQARRYGYLPSAGWQPDPDEMCELATQCTAFIVNNPHNPTGHVVPNELLLRLSGILSSRGAVLIVDEVFRFPDETPSAIGLRNNVVVLGSLSKTHGLPGLRLGWIAAEKQRLSRYRTVQQYLSLALNAFSVTVGRSALNNLAKFDRARLVRGNRATVISWAQRLGQRISISTPMGGTTVCLTVGNGVSEDDLFRSLLDAGVLIAPGNRCFDKGLAKTWFRLGYGTDANSLKCGLARFETVLEEQYDKRS